MKKQSSLPLVLPFMAASITPFTIQADDTLQRIDVVGETQDERRKNQEEMFFKPYSKEVVGQKTIEEEGLPDVAEAIRDLPGVTVTEMGAFSKRIRIRGLQGPRVVSLIDGIKLSNQGMTISGGGETGMIDISNLEKIEVIKGSPSVIYDPGASGGVINMVTHKAPLEKGVGFKQQLSYDQGYDQKKSTTTVNASNGFIGGEFTYAKTNSNDYKINGEDEKKFILDKHNTLNAESPTFLKAENLGYDSESAAARISTKIGSKGIIDIDWENWTGKDMTLIYGPTITDAIVQQYDRMDRNLQTIGYRHESAGNLKNFHIKYAKQSQFQALGNLAQGVTLDSQQLNLAGDLDFNDLAIKFGGEIIFDQAETLVYSEQDYYGAFANFEYILQDWTFFGGARWNQWKTTQKLLDDANADVAKQLVGISGQTVPIDLSAPTFAVAVQYAVNPNNNISLNLNTTYRAPDLMDRYSFGTVEGDPNLKPEEGQHAEVSWKFLSDSFSFSSSVFYSDFKNYIWTKQIRDLKPGAAEAIAECTRLGFCKPSIGEFNDRESDFFDMRFKRYNSEKVTNWGAEIYGIYGIPQHEIIFSSSFNEIKSEDDFVQSAANPLQTTASYRYEFNNSWRPWLKFKAEYVMDFPEVRQQGGFDGYLLGNFYAGFKKNGFVVSGGVRNLSDKKYYAAYSGVYGLSRTYFANVSYEFDSR